jgi:hypothetical protein
LLRRLRRNADLEGEIGSTESCQWHGGVDRSETHCGDIIAQVDDGDFAPGQAVECSDAEAAILRAELMVRDRGNVGSAAFSRRGDPDRGEFGRGDPRSLATYRKASTSPERWRWRP